MSASRPSSLPENAGLAFIGEPGWPQARLTARVAKLFAAAPNPSGRPNSDVLRNSIGLVAGKITEQPQIDFPSHFTEQEAALYREPFRQLHSRGAAPRDDRAWWINPHAAAELRTALARLERYLAMPVDAKTPEWSWIDSHNLPDASLLAVARDDDFTAGILQSSTFQSWWRRHSAQLPPVKIVSSFPFPWPPNKLLSALNRTQEEQRHALARAARSGNRDQIDSAVVAAYNWSNDSVDDETLAKLTQLNRARTLASN